MTDAFDVVIAGGGIAGLTAGEGAVAALAADRYLAGGAWPERTFDQATEAALVEGGTGR